MRKFIALGKAQILVEFEQSLPLQKLQEALLQNEKSVSVSGLVGSAVSVVAASVFLSTHKSLLLVLSDKEKAAYHLNDLEQLLPDAEVLFFPSSHRRPYTLEETENANVLMRSEVLNAVVNSKKPTLVVSYPDALFEKVITQKNLIQQALHISVGEKITLDDLNQTLFDMHFDRVDFVVEPGQFSVRGGLVDVFSYSHDLPHRIEFFGNEIESIRSFDLETQLSIQKTVEFRILPNLELKNLDVERESLIEFLGLKTTVFVDHFSLITYRLNNLFEKAEVNFQSLNPDIKYAHPNQLFCNSKSFIEHVKKQQLIALTQLPKDHFPAEVAVSFLTKPQPTFNKHFDLLFHNLNTLTDQGYVNYICCNNKQQAKRFNDIMESAEHSAEFKTIELPLHEGFVDENIKVACYTDHQIFERYQKFHLKHNFDKVEAISMKELNSLQVGDFVTHIDHGVGRFAGLQKIEVEGKFQEAIKLIYAERDILYLSIHALHKIAKFNGKEGTAPKLYKLGSKAWTALKQKTKSRVKEIAFNLIKLYAERRSKRGFQFAPDSYLQHELEASFIYEDTPDQITATVDVKNDMESDRPMDRLVCGDVGFGKTEVAIRAAFKAVDNGKQVAVLVPTTILAFQHHRTFVERFSELPVTVDYLNRFRTATERMDVLQRLEKGQIDVVIGTHQLINANIKFKDLGLLIVDEEQKFGVAAKDKLKTLKTDVDVLTLTATPIPRTLQFSLMAARDLSIINTPPPNRYPIDSHVIRFSESLIRDAISYEIQRGGQVFFVHNRIENIKEVAGMIQRLVPDAKIGVGHGQLDGKKLEGLMLDFMNGQFDVLVSTTIIESGLDVPNANTMIINNANNFGLSDLHQMRGRVGRSNKKAFCYFITPEYSEMTDDARKRIQALEQNSGLGSGFNIAMKDLEIRGAGDLLGGEQSGFINDIGFETYQKILNEAIDELKHKEFSELYESERNKGPYVKEVAIDTDFDLRLPDTYVNIVSERLDLYTQLSQLKDQESWNQFKAALADRFGPLPQPAVDLMTSVQLKWLAASFGMDRLVMKNNKLLAYFINDQQSDFFQGDAFSAILQFAQKYPQRCKLKEKQTKQGLRLLMVCESLHSVHEVHELFNDLCENLAQK